MPDLDDLKREVLTLRDKRNGAQLQAPGNRAAARTVS
jgi:hypothetical protein